MTDAETIRAVRLFPVVLLLVMAVPHRLAVHRLGPAVPHRQVLAVLLRLAVLPIRTVQLRQVLAVLLRLAVLLTRTVQLRQVLAVPLRLAVLATQAVLLRPVTVVAMSAAKAARLKMHARSPS